MLTTKEELTDFLRDKEFRGYFTLDQVYELLVVQIRQLREKHGWTQAELGERAGMLQEAISRAERPDYRGTRISTLGKLASAFDVALIVRLAPFSELADWVAQLSEASFEPPSFTEENATRQVTSRLSSESAKAVGGTEPFDGFGTATPSLPISPASIPFEGTAESAPDTPRKEESYARAA